MILGLGWDVEASSLSIHCGAAAGPFRPYGGLLFSWEKVGKTARSSIRPYAALRVPSLRCLPGASRPTTCFAKSTSRVFGLGRRVLRTSPLQTPTLSLLKSRSYGRRLHWRICESRCWRSHADAVQTSPLVKRVPTCLVLILILILILMFMHALPGAAKSDFRRPSGGACRGGAQHLRRQPKTRDVDLRSKS
ncbi:hypothetical protein ABIE20_000964 [Pseudomonas sp. 2835]